MGSSVPGGDLDAIIARLRAEFGQPHVLGGNARWSVRAGDGQRTINIMVERDSSGQILVRVSDPSGGEGAAGRCFPVTEPQAIEVVIRDVRLRALPAC